MDESVQLIRLPWISLYRVGFVDSAGGRTGALKTARSQNKRSRSAIVVLGQDDATRIFTLKAWIRHCTTDELIDEIFNTQKEWKPAVLGIDASGTQGLFADALIREAREKGKALPLTKVPMETDKDFRIETALQPAQSAGRLLMREDQDELKAEYIAFPTSGFKDGLDAYTGAMRLLPKRMSVAEATEEVDQYRAYLRSCRLSESLIQRKIEEAFPDGRRSRLLDEGSS